MITINHLLEKAQNLQLRSEMEVFLYHVLGKSRLDLLRDAQEPVPAELLSQIQVGWVRILNGEPVAYLTGNKEFYGLDFSVSSHVLIPRGETEFMIEFAEKNAPEKARILDMGTGSGAIAVALKKNRPDLELWASDVSEQALECAKLNAEKHSCEINFLQADLLDFPEKSAFPRIDFFMILANLPYIGEGKHDFLADSVKNFEPHLALYGGFDGLELYRRFFDQHKALNLSTNYILIEIGFSQGFEALELCKEKMPEYEAFLQKDLQGLDRHIILSYTAKDE